MTTQSASSLSLIGRRFSEIRGFAPRSVFFAGSSPSPAARAGRRTRQGKKNGGSKAAAHNAYQKQRCPLADLLRFTAKGHPWFLISNIIDYLSFCGVTAYKIFPVLGYSLLCNAPLHGSHDAGNIGVFFSDPLQPSSPCRHGSGVSLLYIGLTFFCT